MAVVVIKVASVDITAKVVFEQASFDSAVNGAAGPAKLLVRDDSSSLVLVTGSTLELLIDGDPIWTGFVTSVVRTYVFPALNVDDFGLSRFFRVEGIDLNILFTKRIVFNQITPSNAYGKLYVPGTADNVAIADLVADYLDLSGDSLDVSTFVENVADINVDQDARAWSGGDTWAQAMQSIAALPGAVYFIDPTRNLVYTDVNTPTAARGLSDQPGSGDAGYREMEIVEDGSGLANDVLAWGRGYGSDEPVFVRDEDATSQALHGLWQAGVVRPGIYKQATIDRVAASIVDGSPSNKRGSKNDKVAVTLVTYEPGFLPAQKVAFESNIFGFSDVIPIRKMRVTFEGPDTPKYELILSHDIDQPWGFLDKLLVDWPGFPGYNGPEIKIVWPPPPFWPCWIDPFSCGITDAFNRVVVGAGGTSDAGIAWVIRNFNDPNPSGLSYGVAAGSLTVTADNVSVEWGSIELPLTGVDSFTARFVLHDYPSDWFGFIDLQTPASDAAAFATLSPRFSLLEAKGSEVNSVSFVFDGRPVNVMIAYGSQVKVKAWYDGDAEPAWMVSAPVGDRTLPAAFVVEFDGFQTNGDTASISQLEIAQSSVREMADLFSRTVAAGGWGNSPEGFTWIAFTHAAGLSVTGTKGELLSDNAGTRTAAYITNSAAPWNATAYRARIVFEVRDAPIEAAFLVPSRVTDFNVTIGVVEEIQIQIAATAGPPLSGLPKSYIAFNNATTYIAPAFWVAGGIYTLEIVVAGSTLTAAISDGTSRYDVVGDASSRVDRLLVENAYFGPGTAGDSQLIRVDDIRIDPTLVGVDRCAGAQPVQDDGILDTFDRNLSGFAGSTSWGAYLWENTPNAASDPDMSVDGRWEVRITQTGAFSNSSAINVELPLDPKQLNVNLTFGVGLAAPSTGARSSGYLRFKIDRLGPTTSETIWVTANMTKQDGDSDWSSTLQIRTPTGISTFGTAYNGSLFGAAGLAITVTPTSVAAVAGGLSGSRSWTADATQDSSLTEALIGIEAYLENNGSDPANNPSYLAYAETLRLTSTLGNCVVVPHAAPEVLAFASGVAGSACETPTRVTSTLFTVRQAFVPNSTIVTANGVLQRRGVDYTEGSNHVSVVFSTPVVELTPMRVCYQAAILG